MISQQLKMVRMKGYKFYNTIYKKLDTAVFYHSPLCPQIVAVLIMELSLACWYKYLV